MAKKVQLMTNPKQWQVVDGVEVLVDVPQEDLDPITDSSCVVIEGHRTLEETINQENMFTPQITETKVNSKVGGVYHDNVVDGAYEEAILYGNTQVNLVESVTTGSKYIPHSFTSFQGNESKIGNYNSGRTNQVAPLVKGVTMVNLVQEGSRTLEGGISLVVYNVKGNTKYTLKFTFTQKNNMAGIVIQSYKDENGTLTYLENSKLQSGLGDEVTITFTTHEQANRVHICNGSDYGGETIQLDNIMVIEGDVTDLDLPFFKGMRSVELSRPLTNLFTDDLQIYNSNVTSTISNGNITVTSTSINIWTSSSIYFKDLLKPNTKYLVMWDDLTATQTVVGETIISSYAFTSNTNLKVSDSDIIRPTLRSYVFDTGNFDVNDIVVRIHATTSNSETGITTVTGLRVFEWDDSLRTLDLQTIGYFSGTKYVSARALETEGKNLYPYGDVSFTSINTSWFDSKGTELMYGDIALKSKARFLLKKGSYIASFSECANVYNSNIQIVNDKEEIIRIVKIDDTSATFTLMNDTYCTVRVMPSATDVSVTVKNIQIERGETATEYEVYNSRYYKPRETEEVILRSLPNGVCDTFNLQTGELVQNIGEAVLDGSDVEYTLNHTYMTEVSTAILTSVFSNRDIYEPIICGDFPVYMFSDEIWSKENGIALGVSFVSGMWGFCIRLPHTLTGVTTVDSEDTVKQKFKTYLQSNPITVQYELQEPIITKLQTYDRVYNGQTNGLVSMSNNLSALTYYSNNYYLKVGNLSPVPAILEPVTTIPYNVRLKPSTLYTIKYNRGGYSSSMKFDLGGSVVEKTNLITRAGSVAEELTVRTPAILSHEQLILSGTGYAYNFIVVEGDITGTELPYFEGMKDVKMPIVKNIGKNLLDESSMRVFYESDIVLRTYDVFPCKPNTRYCFISVGGEISCNWHVCKKDAHYERPENESVGMIQYLGYTKEVVTPQDCYYMCIHTGSNLTTDREVYDIKTAIYEGSFAECVNYGYEDYKENSVYAVQGEYPITSEMIEQGGFTTGNPSSDGSYETMKYGEENANYLKRLRSKDLIPVKPNTTYAFTHSFSRFGYNIYQWNGNREFLQETSQYFASGQIETITTTANTQYIHFLISKHNASETITVAEYDWSQFHMYELDSTINLRSLPNGVKDELNLLTGEYIQRVGEVVVDGSGDYTTHIHASSTHYGFRVPVTLKPKTSLYELYPRPIICDKLPYINYSSYFNGLAEGVSMFEGESSTVTSVYVSFDRNRINMPQENNSINHVKEYCKTNPLTIQYELAEPIISHVRLVSNNQEREVGVKLPQGQVNTYNPSTGITTIRVGKIVLDGSEDWYFSTTKTNTQVFGLVVADIATTQNNLYCETMRVGTGIDAEIIATVGGTLFIGLLKTKASTVDELKTYLASNPVTVWYELKYPQIQPDIVLPNGVHDEYNPETGVYTKKVGFVELDGSKDERWSPQVVAGNSTHCYASITIDGTISLEMKQMVNTDEIYIISDSFETVSRNEFRYDTTEIYVWSGRVVYVNMPQKNLTAIDLVSWRNYLSQHPIKLWYELQTPITYQLTPYFGLPQPYAYEDGYLIHDSAYAKTTLPPEFKYKLVANRTGQVMQNNRKLQEHTTRLSNLEAIIIEATIESLFNRELQLFELELMDIQLIDLGE
jgi:hypothetical protein